MVKIAYLCITDVKIMRNIRKIGSILLVSLLIAATGGYPICRRLIQGGRYWWLITSSN